MSTNLFVFAKITPKPKHFEEVKRAILHIVPATRDECGCIEFVLLEDGHGNLCLHEEWTDELALQAHYEMDYVKPVFKAYESWLMQPVEIIKMKKVC